MLATPYPTAGYLQWQTSQTMVELDDLVVESIDLTAPPAPTAATMIIHGDGSATAQIEYGLGKPADIATTFIYESPSPITTDLDPATLTIVGQATGAATTLNAASVNQAAYQAAGVIDRNGNRSGVVAISIDTTAPSSVSDLREP
jgi:hypothetical protein